MKDLSHYHRREFLGIAGKGLLATGILSQVPFDSFALSTEPSGKQPMDRTPIETPPLKPLKDSTEQQESPPEPILEPSKRLGYCIVGLGHLSLGQILPAFGKCKYSKPVALVSGDAAKAAKVAAQYGISAKSIYNYQNYDEIRNNKEIDIVYIVLPNSMHEEYTIRAANAGKHVLCEKPMAVSVDGAQRMIDACKKASRKLMIAYRIQYEPHNKLVKEWARSKEHGHVKLIESVNNQNQGDPTQWRLKKSMGGGGPLPDTGIYIINTSRYILGEEPDWVLGSTYSTPGDNRFKEVEETALFQMRFPSGVLVNGMTTFGAHESRRYRCYTDKGAWFGMDPAYSYENLELELSKAKGTLEYKQKLMMEPKDHFAVEMDHMSWCVIHDKRPYTPGEEGLQDHKIIDAIYKSAAENRPVALEKITETDAFRGTKPE